jgi:hypothetical protein
MAVVRIDSRKKREEFMKKKLGGYYDRAMAVFAKFGKFFPYTITKLALMAAGDQGKMEKTLRMFEDSGKIVNAEKTRRLIRRVYQEVFGIKIRAKVTAEAA